MGPSRFVQFARALPVVVAATTAVGCTASPDTPTTIRVVNWWSSAGESEART